MDRKETYLTIVEELLGLLSNSHNQGVLNQVYFRTLTLVESLYGENNIRISTLTKFKTERYDPLSWHTQHITDFSGFLIGILNGIKKDIENELIFNIEKQTIGSVVGDFISLAKDSAENNNKDVAAVLASAAIEDSLKRYGMLNSVEVEGQEMNEVINALKAKSLLKGPSASLLSSYVKMRNKSFHAEWDKIEMSDVKSLISFTESFILENLS